jgi:PEP-CTERM motif
MRYLLGCALLCMLAAPALAITVDGTRDAGYGSALAVQTVETQFGDANPNLGSEWDAGYGVIEVGKLYLMLTGNLEANFNKLEIFIDSKAGGQSAFDSSGNDNAGRMDGLVFDAGFTADYHIIARRGNSSGNDTFDLDFANLVAQSASGYLDIMGGNSGTGSTGTGVNASPIDVSYDNSNTAGVAGGTNAANQAAAAAVTTGLELSIALSDLGYTGGPINVMVGQNGGGHDFFSNQFLGGLAPPQGNLGGDGNGNFTGTAAINFQNFAGNQYFTVPVPEPASVTLMGLVLAGLACVRRRK